MTPTHLIFDLDNTLYPPSRGVVERVDDRINRFMIERLGMSLDLAATLRARYRDAYGTTLNGLMRHHGIEPDDYLDAVHEIAVEELLAPDRELQSMLALLPHRKVVFTNGSAAHADRVLACLAVREHFHDVFSLERVSYVPKPERAAFETVLATLDVAAGACLFLDDRQDNLATARTLGMRTVLVGDGAAPEPWLDGAIPSVLELPTLLAALHAS
ncbi:MAG TPA: pyrimidine 5'-nucleotidase [Kofleriaceae bacterium]